MKAVPGISLVYDALFVALTHAPAAGRRHLIVAMTDGEDCGSLLDGARVLDASGRSEAVLHWIYVSSQGDFDPNAIGAWCTPGDAREVNFVEQSALRTGGDRHRSRFGDPAVRTFAQILDEFRQSYVLRYSPQGVKGTGWHAVVVQVPAQPALTIKARSGYFGTPKKIPGPLSCACKAAHHERHARDAHDADAHGVDPRAARTAAAPRRRARQRRNGAALSRSIA